MQLVLAEGERGQWIGIHSLHNFIRGREIEIFLSYRILFGTSGGFNEAGIKAKYCLVRCSYLELNVGIGRVRLLGIIHA